MNQAAEQADEVEADDKSKIVILIVDSPVFRFLFFCNASIFDMATVFSAAAR
jgi:hypothetical protein